MAQQFDLLFYENPNGETPVVDFIKSLNPEMQFKMVKALDRLEMAGNHCKGDLTRKVTDTDFFELRAQNKTDISRIFFFFGDRGEIVLSNGFIKKDERPPLVRKDIARRHKKEYESRERKERRHLPKDNCSGPRWRETFNNIIKEAEEKKDAQITDKGHNKSKGAYNYTKNHR